jgi:CheY-like chemotaxis protein
MSSVLIVDDNATARETLVAILEGEGYDLQQAKDGIQALTMLKQLQPDLILLDVMMPAMDGFEVCRRIRATPPLAEVPIILLTALDSNRARTIFSPNRRTAASLLHESVRLPVSIATAP